MTKAKLIKQLLTLKNLRTGAARSGRIWSRDNRESSYLYDMLKDIREGASKSMGRGIRYSDIAARLNAYRPVSFTVNAGRQVPKGVPHFGGDVAGVTTSYILRTEDLRPARQAILNRIAEIRRRSQTAARVLGGRMRTELGIAGGYAGAAGASGYGAYNLIKKLVESRKAQQSTAAQPPGDPNTLLKRANRFTDYFAGDNVSTGKRIARILGTTGLVAGTALTGRGLIRSLRAGRTFAKMMRGSKRVPLDVLKAKGIMPQNAVIVSSPDELRAALGVKEPGGLRKLIENLMIRSRMGAAFKGENAAFVGTNTKGVPIFAGARDGMNETVAAHEVGHFRDALARAERNLFANYNLDYSQAAREARSPLRLFVRRLLTNTNGTRTQAGFELDAWRAAPVRIKASDPIRRAALRTYLVNQKTAPQIVAGGSLIGYGGVANWLASGDKKPDPAKENTQK